MMNLHFNQILDWNSLAKQILTVQSMQWQDYLFLDLYHIAIGRQITRVFPPFFPSCVKALGKSLRVLGVISASDNAWVYELHGNDSHQCCVQHLYSCTILSLSILMAIFPGVPGLVSLIGAKEGGSGDEEWSYKTCQTPVKSSSPTPTFYRPDALPVAQPTVSKHLREISHSTDLLTWGLPTLFLTTKGSWLPWDQVAMPLFSPLMSLPQYSNTLHSAVDRAVCCGGW